MKTLVQAEALGVGYYMRLTSIIPPPELAHDKSVDLTAEDYITPLVECE